jgi:hypothetical protein
MTTTAHIATTTTTTTTSTNITPTTTIVSVSKMQPKSVLKYKLLKMSL